MKRIILTLALFSATLLQVPGFRFQVVSAQTTDRGFIHPGGLHTQVDFDRVKAQLEAGNSKVKQAYAKLTSAAYAQSSASPAARQ